MGSFSVWHWAIVLIIVMLVFGTKKLANIGTDLGTAIKGFREGVRENDDMSEQKMILPIDDNSAKEIVNKEKAGSSVANA